MIDYDGGAWQVGFVLSLRGSVFPKSCVWAIISSAIALVFHGHMAAESVGGALSSVWGSVLFVLGFLVVFRTQQAYSRFWEGATILQQVRGEWFNAASSVIAFSSTKPELREETDHFHSVFVRLMSLLYCTALQQVAVLADEQFEIINIDGMDESALQYLAVMSEQKTEVLLQWIQRLVVEGMRAGILDVPPPILSRVFQELSRGVVNVVNAQKIMDTLFPFPYAQMITLLLLSTTFFTPFVNCLLVYSRYWAAATTFMTVFAFWSINYIAAEIELPFGDDPNDLPIRNLMHEMNKNLLMLLHKEAQAPPMFNFGDEEKMHVFRTPAPGKMKTQRCPILHDPNEEEAVLHGHKATKSRHHSLMCSYWGCCASCLGAWSGTQSAPVPELTKGEKRSSRASRRSISNMEMADSAMRPAVDLLHTPQHKALSVDAEETPVEKAGPSTEQPGRHVEAHETDADVEPGGWMHEKGPPPRSSSPCSLSGGRQVTRDTAGSGESELQGTVVVQAEAATCVGLLSPVPVADPVATSTSRRPVAHHRHAEGRHGAPSLRRL